MTPALLHSHPGNRKKIVQDKHQIYTTLFANDKSKAKHLRHQLVSIGDNCKGNINRNIRVIVVKQTDHHDTSKF